MHYSPFSTFESGFIFMNNINMNQIVMIFIVDDVFLETASNQFNVGKFFKIVFGDFILF
jgi:hypothetical protein